MFSRPGRVEIWVEVDILSNICSVMLISPLRSV